MQYIAISDLSELLSYVLLKLVCLHSVCSKCHTQFLEIGHQVSYEHFEYVFLSETSLKVSFHIICTQTLYQDEDFDNDA